MHRIYNFMGIKESVRIARLNLAEAVLKQLANQTPQQRVAPVNPGTYADMVKLRRDLEQEERDKMHKEFIKNRTRGGSEEEAGSGRRDTMRSGTSMNTGKTKPRN